MHPGSLHPCTGSTGPQYREAGSQHRHNFYFSYVAFLYVLSKSGSIAILYVEVDSLSLLILKTLNDFLSVFRRLLSVPADFNYMHYTTNPFVSLCMSRPWF